MADNVLERAAHVLKGKELGIVLTTGVAEKNTKLEERRIYDFRILRPYQRIANKFHMTYLPPFVLAQFMYLSQEKRWEKLIAYQQYLSLEGKPSLTQRIDWFIQRVQENQKMQEEESEKQAYIVEALTEAKSRSKT